MNTSHIGDAGRNSSPGTPKIMQNQIVYRINNRNIRADLPNAVGTVTQPWSAEPNQELRTRDVPVSVVGS
jgi:hypothetical protein